MPKFFVVQTIWHEGQRRHALPGELVELDHLSATQIEKLAAANVIVAEEKGRGQFTRNLVSDRPPLPPEVVAQAEAQAAQAAAAATAQPEPAPKRASRKKKE